MTENEIIAEKIAIEIRLRELRDECREMLKKLEEGVKNYG